MKQSIFILLALLSSPSLACEAPPRAQYTPPDELIARTKTIALARVTKAELADDGYETIYTFSTLRVLRGEPAKTFQVRGYPGIWEGENRRFNDHADKEFWTNPGGRLTLSPDCEIHPTFSVGGTYLMFLDTPYHNKSFELILRTHGGAEIQDKWLQYVQARVKS